jgi:hypothetical protein
VGRQTSRRSGKAGTASGREISRLHVTTFDVLIDLADEA